MLQEQNTRQISLHKSINKQASLDRPVGLPLDYRKCGVITTAGAKSGYRRGGLSPPHLL